VTAHCLSVVLVNAAVRTSLKSILRASWSHVNPPPGANLLWRVLIWDSTQSSTSGPLISDKAKLMRK
jgi:hypothetical protein